MLKIMALHTPPSTLFHTRIENEVTEVSKTLNELRWLAHDRLEWWSLSAVMLHRELRERRNTPDMGGSLSSQNIDDMHKNHGDI